MISFLVTYGLLIYNPMLNENTYIILSLEWGYLNLFPRIDKKFDL